MLSYGLAVGYALFLWWFSTGVILYLDKRPEGTYTSSLLGASVVALGALVTIAATRHLDTALSAYLAFTAGVVVWGWMEMTYFMGFITGPRKSPCPDDCDGWRRFKLALQTSVYHELAIVAVGGLLIWLTWGAANQVGTWTYAILWLMRWSAKLNLFFGVPNLNEEWLPERIRFLTTYLNKRPMNLLFPVSVTSATVIMCLLVEMALELPADGFAGTALILAATLLALAILEHWLLVLPVTDGALWQWALGAAADAKALRSEEGSREGSIDGARDGAVGSRTGMNKQGGSVSAVAHREPVLGRVKWL